MAYCIVLKISTGYVHVYVLSQPCVILVLYWYVLAPVCIKHMEILFTVQGIHTILNERC
jgi:hypothetical protein